ncbi:MAG: hypothetical protein ACR2RE_15520, partial [Geminicoccaceae bacterium]
ALPEPANGEYSVRWQSLSDPGEREQAETALTWGRAAQSFQTASRIITPAEARERFLGMDGNAPDVSTEDGVLPADPGKASTEDDESSTEDAVV